MRSCERCGAPIPLQKGRGMRRKYCQTCSPSRKKPQKPGKPAQKPANTSRSVVASVTAELTEAKMLDSHQGQAALLLAHRLESGDDTGAALAQMVRQLRETMVAALASVEPDEVDPVDELRARRESRGA